MDHDEYTFLCGYQKIRRYGSTNNLNSQNYNSKLNRYSRIIVHKVELSDTLQCLELKYNSSMYEIKRLNRLWSNDSLYCKTHLNIPIFDNGFSSNSSSFKSNLLLYNNNAKDVKDSNNTSNFSMGMQQKIENVKWNSSACSLEKVDEKESESLDQFFNRIDKNVKKTKKVVKQLNKKTLDKNGF